jgi:hypothetical protein
LLQLFLGQDLVVFFLFLLEVILFEWYWILNIRVPFLVKQTE